MTTHKDFKRLVRGRMQKTGEAYTAARAHLLQHKPKAAPPEPKPAARPKPAEYAGLAGHTDAAGGDNYNQELSERRADSIKRYLMDNYHIAATDLVTVGYGKSKLKDPAQPLAEVNRRVQVVNMENKTTASK